VQTHTFTTHTTYTLVWGLSFECLLRRGWVLEGQGRWCTQSMGSHSLKCILRKVWVALEGTTWEVTHSTKGMDGCARSSSARLLLGRPVIEETSQGPVCRMYRQFRQWVHAQPWRHGEHTHIHAHTHTYTHKHHYFWNNCGTLDLPSSNWNAGVLGRPSITATPLWGTWVAAEEMGPPWWLEVKVGAAW